MSATRAILAGRLDPASALALDEGLARAGAHRLSLALWRTEPAVVIGRFQRADWEVDAGACAGRDVRVWRRFTGGGAVYLDPGTVCAALCVPAAHPLSGLGVPQMYAPLLEAIVGALAACGVTATRDERTVRVDGHKVTGIAAHRGRGGHLVHGTLLVDADLEALRACLAGTRGGELGGLPRPAASRPDTVANTGAERFEERLCEALDAEPGPLEPGEQSLVEQLRRDRYLTRAWHAGPWQEATAADVVEVLGGAAM